MSHLRTQVTYKPSSLLDSKHVRAVLFNNRSRLLASRFTVTVNTDGLNATKFKYNLYGYLNDIKVEDTLHWITMVMNNMTNPEQFDDSIKELKIPDITAVQDILNMANS